jgi:hypothetical protein
MNSRCRKPPPESHATAGRTPWRRMTMPLFATGLAALAACGQVELDAASEPPDTDGMLGTWAVDFRAGDGVTYLGTLDVLKSTGPGSYRGNLRFEFTSERGDDEAVEEDAYISVQGRQVAVNCRKPVVVTENGDYVPDNFYLTRQGGNVMKGIEKDILAVGGTATFTKK